MILAEGLSRPEGPVALPDGSWLVVEMGEDRGCVTHLSADGQTKRVIVKTGRPNGLARDRHGVLWVAESLNPPSLLRMTMDGRYEVFLTECEGEPFLFPNDLCFGPDGALYMSDSGVPYRDWASRMTEYREVRTDGRVYRIDVTTKEATRLDNGLRFTNGIAFGPDGDLYANETISGDVLRYRSLGGGRFGDRELFVNILDPEGPDTFKGPDGMAFGRDGRLYVTVLGQGDVTVLDPDGRVVTRHPLDGKLPTNVAFGRPGDRRIFVTEQGVGRVEVLDVETDGLPLHGGP